MSPGSWFVVVAYTFVAAGLAPLLWPLWRLSRRHPDQKASFYTWAGLIALTASCPVVVLASWGRVGMVYPGIVSAAVVLTGVVSAVARREAIARALRERKQTDDS